MYLPFYSDNHRQLHEPFAGEFVPGRSLAAPRKLHESHVSKALAADDAFHHVIIEAAGNPVIARVIEQLHPQLHRILYRKFSGLLGGEETINHHDQLIKVCEQGDAQAAAAMSGEHWSHLAELISGLFDSNELSS